MIGVYIYILIGMLLYSWAFPFDRIPTGHDLVNDLKNLLIVVTLWPLIFAVAFARAAKKRDHWWEDKD